MLRVPPVTDRASLPAEYHGLFDRIAQTRGGVMEGPYSVLLHSPAVAASVERIAVTLRAEGELRPDEFALAALTVAWAKQAAFVWAVQVANARRAGLPDAVFAALRADDPSSLPPEQADLVSFARQLVGGTGVDQATFDRLRERRGVRWLVELTVTVGNFQLFADVVNVFAVPPPDAGEPLRPGS